MVKAGRRLTRIANDDFENFRLNISRCRNRDGAPLKFTIFLSFLFTGRFGTELNLLNLEVYGTHVGVSVNWYMASLATSVTELSRWLRHLTGVRRVLGSLLAIILFLCPVLATD